MGAGGDIISGIHKIVHGLINEYQRAPGEHGKYRFRATVGALAQGRYPGAEMTH
jgi:hypothetical protein